MIKKSLYDPDGNKLKELTYDEKGKLIGEKTFDPEKRKDDPDHFYDSEGLTIYT